MPTSSRSPGSGAAVRFEHVSKRYRLGGARLSLRDTLSQLLPWVGKQRAGMPPESEVLWALHDVSFELARGRSLALIGPNGAGKTTALKLMAHITQPASGRIEIAGRVSSLIELGAGFHPELTGRENLYLNAAILGMPQKEVARLFDRIVDFAELERFIDTPVKHYSSGMYVRLGFAVSAHVDPDVLLVDEVLAVGDAQFRQKCAECIARLRANGTTIVFVSHNMPLVRSVCDEGIFFADGQIQVHGDVVEAIRAYETHVQRLQMERALQPADSPDPSEACPVVIRQIEVQGLGQEGRPGSELRYDESALIRIHFTVQEPISQPGLVVHILGADGGVSCMIRSRDYGYVLDDLSGEGLIEVVVDPLQLASGAYSIEARLMGMLEGRPLAIGHSSWFQVAGISAGHLSMGGVFVPHVARIRVEQNRAALQPFTEPLPGELVT